MNAHPHRVVKRYRRPEDRPMPTLRKRSVNLAKAAGRAAGAIIRGLPVIVSDEEAARRLCICRECEWWRTEAYGGAGGCGHESCGCTALKRHLSTERCPVGRWDD